MGRGQELLSGHLVQQPNPVVERTTTDTVSRANVVVGDWGAFANRLLRNYTRKYMFKFWNIEKRRRAIVMRENMARRTLIRANPQHGPFRPIDMHEDSQSDDDEPTFSVAPAASDVQIEVWMSSMHQALLGRNFRLTSIPETSVLVIWRN